MSRTAWQCVGAGKRYGTTPALVDATFDCRYGEITALLGHNGAGKSTLFKAAAGLLELDAGSMTLAGHSVDSRQARQRVSFMPEQPDLYPGVSVWEHLVFMSLAYRLRTWQARADELMATFGLADVRDALPHELSQGLRRRLALVMALLHGAEILLLDEPFNGLDPHAARQLRESVRHLAASGACVVLTTHILPDVERVADRLIMLDHGRVTATGSLPDLVRHAGLPRDSNLEETYLALTAGVP